MIRAIGRMMAFATSLRIGVHRALMILIVVPSRCVCRFVHCAAFCSKQTLYICMQLLVKWIDDSCRFANSGCATSAHLAYRKLIQKTAVVPRVRWCDFSCHIVDHMHLMHLLAYLCGAY